MGKRNMLNISSFLAPSAERERELFNDALWEEAGIVNLIHGGLPVEDDFSIDIADPRPGGVLEPDEGDVFYGDIKHFQRAYDHFREEGKPSGIAYRPVLAPRWFTLGASDVSIVARSLGVSPEELSERLSEDISLYNSFESNRDRDLYVGVALCFKEGFIRHVFVYGYMTPRAFLLERAQMAKRHEGLLVLDEANARGEETWPSSTGLPSGSDSDCADWSVFWGGDGTPHGPWGSANPVVMVRKFLPVGQGAFYCERFRNGISVVYDCGSSTKKGLVEQRIDDEFTDRRHIKIVFISHLHSDHVNGLHHLLDQYEVDAVVFPYLNQQERMLQFGACCTMPGRTDFLEDFILRPRHAVDDVSPETRLIAVAGSGNEAEDYRDTPVASAQELVDSGVLEDSAVLAVLGSGVSIGMRCAGALDWRYIPHSFRHEDRSIALRDELKRRGISIADVVMAFKTSDPARIKTVKDAYSVAACKNFNSHSMTVLSTPRDTSLLQRVSDRPSSDGYPAMALKALLSICRPSGCLFTGDYEAGGKLKWKELEQAYSDYIQHIGCIQLPHHGSRHNFREEFALFDAFLVASADSNKRYRHPHKDTLTQLLEHRRLLLLVTEKERSEVDFEVYK